MSGARYRAATEQRTGALPQKAAIIAEAYRDVEACATNCPQDTMLLCGSRDAIPGRGCRGGGPPLAACRAQRHEHGTNKRTKLRNYETAKLSEPWNKEANLRNCGTAELSKPWNRGANEQPNKPAKLRNCRTEQTLEQGANRTEDR
jgi:hypothetical protein